MNFVLRCSGCDARLDINDIEDPDNATHRLEDFQDQYAEQKAHDYPLISRAKGNPVSRPILQAFFQRLIETAHMTGLLYSDEALTENIQIWVVTMSAASIRPFRHTATVVSLAMGTAVCNNVKELAANMAATARLKEVEERKKATNKGRIASLKKKIDEIQRKRESAQAMLKDTFDTVWVHRYRDVDPRLRTDCTTALGVWMQTCPDIFFTAEYLRYFGWLLSDTSSARGEVVKSLLKLYKDPENLGRLRAFTERFRTRMIEMATQDVDPIIRASTVELLDLIRKIGLLQPDDIDTIGKLIFDSEPRVRKAIAPFFTANVDDTLEVVLDELGGAELIDESMGEDPDDYERLRKGWLRLKCIAEVLDSYDDEASEENAMVSGMESLMAVGDLESRYSLAAKVVCEGDEAARAWEVIAGFLLYDMSQTSQVPTDDPVDALKKRCQLSEKEEKLLLEVLLVAVRMRLVGAAEHETDKKGRRTKTRKEEAQEIKEATALHLAKTIRSLLRKFGANPSTASVVLRLQRILDLEMFQELRQDTTEYAGLLEDINKQFSTHGDSYVLAEASHALLHAKNFEDLENVTEKKLQELWESTVASLRQLISAKTRNMNNIANVVHRISYLAPVSDCIEYFNQEFGHPKSHGAASAKVFDILISLIRSNATATGNAADSLLKSAIDALQYYYLWVASDIIRKVEKSEVILELPSYDIFADVLIQLANARPRLDDVRIFAIMSLLQLHVAFANFQGLEATTSDDGQSLARLAKELNSKGQELVLSTFTAAEKALAKKAKRHLEEAADEEVNEQPESEPEASSDDEHVSDEQARALQVQQRKQASLLAEKRLCDVTGKIVLALVAKVIDKTGERRGTIRKRITRNRGKLGAHFREVLAYLEDPKPKRSHRAKAKSAEKESNKSKATHVSGEIVVDSDEDEEEQNQEEAAQDEEEEPQEPADRVDEEANQAAEANDEDDVMGD